MHGGVGIAGGVLFVLGTRPEAIKLAPVILAMEPAQVSVCLTGQHRDLARAALGDFGIVPDVDLALMRDRQTPAEVVAAAIPAVGGVIERLAPAMVVVQGDTASTLAGALAAAYARVPLGHVEAGLRSGATDPFPEDMHRRLVAQLATVHFAPTPGAVAALIAEGVAPATVYLTGNPVIDALHRIAAQLVDGDPPAPFVAGARPLVLVTAHRRENHGAAMAGIAEALARLAARGDLNIVVALHPHPAAGAVFQRRLGTTAGVTLLPPLDYPAFVGLLRRARLVLTDSGGIQEEAPAFGCPVLVLRDTTERPEGIAAGAAELVGTDPARIVAAVAALIDDPARHAAMATAVSPYGDGRAGARIAAVIGAAIADARAAA